MLVVMQKDATAEQIEAVLQSIRGMNLTPHPMPGATRTAIGITGNVGAVVRTAGAFGASVALSAGCADPTSPRALRASAGVLFRVPLARFDDAPGRRIALVAHSGQPLAEVPLDEPVSLVLGAEREGLPEEIVAQCDEVATIPISGQVESLNVAAAAAIALYEATRR